MKIFFIVLLFISFAYSDDATKFRSEIKQLNKSLASKDEIIRKYKKILKSKEKEILYLKKKLKTTKKISKKNENVFPKLMLKEKYE